VLFLVENLEHNDFVALRNMLLRYDSFCCCFILNMFAAFQFLMLYFTRSAFGLIRRSSRVRPRPLLFNLYTPDIHLLVAAHGLVLQQYADDCQIYIAMPVNETCSRQARCLNDVNAWLNASRLRLNPEKTQILWLESKHLVSDIAVTQVPVLASPLTAAD